VVKHPTSYRKMLGSYPGRKLMILSASHSCLLEHVLWMIYLIFEMFRAMDTQKGEFTHLENLSSLFLLSNSPSPSLLNSIHCFLSSYIFLAAATGIYFLDLLKSPYTFGIYLTQS
jgi:hypothetical protein